MWAVQADGLGTEERPLGEGSDPVWRPGGGQMAFYRFPRGGAPGIWVVEGNMGDMYPLGLPPDAALVDWMAAGPDLAL